MSFFRAVLLNRKVAPLSAAVVLSICAHALVLFAHKIELSMPQDLAKLEARLVRPTPDAKPGEAAPNDQPPKPPVPQPKPKESPQTPVAETETLPREAPPEPQPETVPETPQEPQKETPPPAEPPKAVGYSWPKAGRIRYLLYGGEGRDVSANANAELTWTIEPDGKYHFKLASQDAKPFPSMPWFTISFAYISQGQMVEGQFRPSRYEEQISVFRSIVVNFDWEKKLVDFAGHSLPLQPGTMDYLSVIMQSGDPGFTERGIIQVATGRGVRQYQFETSAEESLSLPFGMTWKVRQLFGKTGNNDVRVWVATERFNLPVQIKFVVNKVNYYLIATEVLVSRDAVAEGPSSKAPDAKNESTIGQAAPVADAPAQITPPPER